MLSPSQATVNALWNHRPRSLDGLRLAFPSACVGHLEDAWQEAALAALAMDARDPLRRPERALDVAAWRQVRALHRRACTRHEQSSTRLPEVAALARLDERLDARAALAAIPQLIDQVAAEQAPRRAAPLAQALRAKMGDPDAHDAAIALRFGLRREMVSRAWATLRRAVAARVSALQAQAGSEA